MLRARTSKAMIPSTTESQLRGCLKGVLFPANREDLLAEAINKGCDKGTVDALGAIPSMTYTKIEQIIASVTIVDRPGGGAAAPQI